MSSEEIVCLFCGVTKEEVLFTRRRDGYTLGCGIESHTENGYDWDELSPKHRWADWQDRELKKQGIAPEFYEEYRRVSIFDIEWADCEHTLTGHRYIETLEQAELFGLKPGTCMKCGKTSPFAERVWSWTCTVCGWEAYGASREEAEGKFIEHAKSRHPKATIVSTVIE